MQRKEIWRDLIWRDLVQLLPHKSSHKRARTGIWRIATTSWLTWFAFNVKTEEQQTIKSWMEGVFHKKIQAKMKITMIYIMIKFNPCSCSMSIVQHGFPCHGVVASPPSRQPHPWATMVPKEHQLPARKPRMFCGFDGDVPGLTCSTEISVLKRYLWDFLEWWKHIPQNYDGNKSPKHYSMILTNCCRIKFYMFISNMHRIYILLNCI